MFERVNNGSLRTKLSSRTVALLKSVSVCCVGIHIECVFERAASL